jgi:hypothetical protein
MLFSNLVSAEFAQKVKDIAGKLGMNADHIMAVIGFETMYTFSPSIRNSIGATGLIQFLPSTAKSLGTTTEALAAMPAVKQLDYVAEYFRRMIKTYGPLTTLVNTYLAVFYPVAITKDDSFKFPAPVGAANKVFDINKDGTITKQEVANTIEAATNKKKAATIR